MHAYYLIYIIDMCIYSTYLWIETEAKLCDTGSDLVEGNRSAASISLDYVHRRTAISCHDDDDMLWLLL